PSGATLGTPANATVSLTDNDPPGTLHWSVTDASGVEGTSLLLTVTRTGGTASDITVDLTPEDGQDAVAGTDYMVVTPSPLPFGLNTMSQVVEIPLLPRPGAQGPRAFRVTLENPQGQAALGSSSTITVWILDSN